MAGCPDLDVKNSDQKILVFFVLVLALVFAIPTDVSYHPTTVTPTCNILKFKASTVEEADISIETSYHPTIYRDPNF